MGTMASLPTKTLTSLFRIGLHTITRGLFRGEGPTVGRQTNDRALSVFQRPSQRWGVVKRRCGGGIEGDAKGAGPDCRPAAE